MEAEFLTTRDVAARMSTTPSNVIKKCQRGQLPHVKVGRRTFIPLAAWKQWLADKTVEALASVEGARR